MPWRNSGAKGADSCSGRPLCGEFLHGRHGGWHGSIPGSATAQPWLATGAIGAVITSGAIVGMLTVAPADALVDATTHKRACVIVVGLGAVAAAAVILTSRQFWVIAGAQAVMCISGATIAPALIGITLGLVGQARFTSQNRRNQAYNHAGNLTGAAIAGLLGWHFGYAAVFWLAAGFAAL